MRTSSKGASEKRRPTQYVTNTVLDDNFKGTTEQFVLHKCITQTNRTNESHKRIAQSKMTSPPRMEMTYDALGCSRTTQVLMEYLRLLI